jgi:hypothetical protein
MADFSFYTGAQPNALLGTAEQAVGVRNAQAQNALLGIGIKQAQQNLGQQQLQYLAGNLGVMANDPNLTAERMHAFAQNAVKEGMLSPQLYQVESDNIDAAGGDPAKLRALAANYSQRALDSLNQYASTQGYAPGSGATPVTYTGPTGAPVNTTLAQFAQAARGGAPQAQPQPTGGATQPTTQTGAAPVPLAPQTNAGAAGGIAGPTPQQQAQFDASSKQQQDDLTNDAGFTANIVPLTKTLSLLPKTPLFGTGAQVPTDVAKVLNTFGIKIGSDQAQNASELEKYLTQLARSSGAAPNSDSQLAAAFSANPNMTTDKAAAQDVVKTMLSLARMQHAKVAAAQQSGIAPEQYSSFASKWGAQQDPRAYGFDLMDDKAKATLRKELDANPAEAQRFIQTYNTAQQLGIFGQ